MFSFFKPVKIKSMNIDEFISTGNQGKLIDVREIEEYQAGKLMGAKNIPTRKILADPEKYLEKEDEYYLYCFSGARSKSVVKKLTKQGYNVVNLIGGYRKVM